MTIKYNPNDVCDIADTAAFAPSGTSYDVGCDRYYHVGTGEEVVPDPRDAILWTLWAVKPPSDDEDGYNTTYYSGDANVHRYLSRNQLVDMLAHYLDRNTQLRFHEAKFELRYFVGTRCELDDYGEPVGVDDFEIDAEAKTKVREVQERRVAAAKEAEERAAEKARDAARARDLAELARLRAQYPGS